MDIRPNRCLLFITILLFGLSACVATNPTKTNLSSVALKGKPIVSIYADSEAKITNYRTFSVFPLSFINNDVRMNEIMEKQLLFFLRTRFEWLGYQFVQLNEGPDFIATIEVNSEYKEHYVEPRAVVAPKWAQGQTITTHSQAYGTLDYGGTIGNFSGFGTSQTYVPGYMTTERYTLPGYMAGYHYPTAAISVYDGKSYQRVWAASGAGISEHPDVRVSSQILINEITHRFPNTPLVRNPDEGVIGIGYDIFTNDGNTFVPTVMYLAENGPAMRAGMEEHDMIISIDGISTENKPFDELDKYFRGRPGSTVALDVWRMGEILSFQMMRVKSSDVQ